MIYLCQSDIAHRVKQLREAHKLSRPKLAKMAGLEASFCYHLEAGGGMSVYSLIKLCKALKLTPNDILCDPPEPSAWDEPEHDSSAEREARDERRIEEFDAKRDGFVSRSDQ